MHLLPVDEAGGELVEVDGAVGIEVDSLHQLLKLPWAHLQAESAIIEFLIRPKVTSWACLLIDSVLVPLLCVQKQLSELPKEIWPAEALLNNRHHRVPLITW